MNSIDWINHHHTHPSAQGRLRNTERILSVASQRMNPTSHLLPSTRARYHAVHTARLPSSPHPNTQSTWAKERQQSKPRKHTKRHRKPDDSAAKRRNDKLPRAHWWARHVRDTRASSASGSSTQPDGHTKCSDKDCWKTPHHNPRSQYGNPPRRDTGLRDSPFTTHFTTLTSFLFLVQFYIPFILASRLHLCHIILTSGSDNILVYFSRRPVGLWGLAGHITKGLEPRNRSNSPLAGFSTNRFNQIKSNQNNYNQTAVLHCVPLACVRDNIRPIPYSSSRPRPPWVFSWRRQIISPHRALRQLTPDP
ncbi:hypothetical protein B0T10DRAFT_42235 [Thelonectria olida]|uniref:Uncharacterized protein n=1 Tax=Thelonectria olida TaxID=1576542 RepID=A0A9P8W7G5_9HYPO|nr:hypothetical protein B0T10DRAFT_42235 [Thelonectria olida]